MLASIRALVYTGNGPAGCVMTEAELVRRAKTGDRAAQEELYRSCARRVFSAALRICRDRHLAEDVSQDAWFRAFTKIGQFKGEASFCGWVYRIARNLAIDRMRPPLVVVMPGDDAVPDRPAPPDFPEECWILLHSCLAKLPPGYHTVLQLYVVEGLSHREIADALAIEHVSSRTQLFKARRMLAECYADCLEDGAAEAAS